MADNIQIDAAGVALIYREVEGVEADAGGVALIYRDEEDPGAVQIRAAGIALIYADFYEAGSRTFPVPQSETVWQSQSGKRKYPLPGAQSEE